MTAKVSKGDKILAAGGLWTVVGVGNGSCRIRCEYSKRIHSIPYCELQADLRDRRAFLANPGAYAKQIMSGVGYKNAMRSVQTALSHDERGGAA